MTSREVIRILEEAGFQKVSKRGSHQKMRHPDGRTAIVPDPKKDIKPGTLHAIERQSKVKLQPSV